MIFQLQEDTAVA